MMRGRVVDLRSGRCILQPVTGGDVEALHAIFTSAGVRRFLWDDEVIPLDRTRAVVEQSEQLFAERGFGLWCARTRDTARAEHGAARRESCPDADASSVDSLTAVGSLVGFGAYWPFRDPPEFELLYGVAEPRWGNGYAPEIARAVLDYCFDRLDLPFVRASTDVGNVASVRVLEKLGFSFVERRTVSGLDTVFYNLARL